MARNPVVRATRTRPWAPALALLLMAGPAPALAGSDDGGWRRQSIDLVSGWNLVWLKVQPPAEADDPASVFGNSVLSVWTFVAGREAGDPGFWLNWNTDLGVPAWVNTLAHIQGSRGYFIESDGAQTIHVTGQPAPRARTLSASTPTLLGGDPAPGGPALNFGAFLALGDVAGHVDEIYRSQPGIGDAALLINPLVNLVEDNAAYWFFTDSDVPYGGPIRIGLPSPGAQFRDDRYSQTMTVEIPTVTDPAGDVVTVQVVPSDAPPPGQPALADSGGIGTDWLQYRDAGGAWQPFPPSGVPLTVAQGEASVTLELRADRRGLAPASLDDPSPSLYQALVRVTDEYGNQAYAGAGVEKRNDTGTWLGRVTASHVELNSTLAATLDDLNIPQTGTLAEPMEFSLILEIAPDGTLKLLDKACVVIDADVDENGNVSQYRRKFTYRAILFPDELTGTGTLERGATFTHVLGATHPLNPYRHRYNPLHQSGYDITRTITLTLTANDPAEANEFLGDLLSQHTGNTHLAGTWGEEITGLSAETITVSGSFRLTRLSKDIDLRDCP